jgi:hypothetical protein
MNDFFTGKRLFSSLLVATAGVMLICDKLFYFHFENNFGYNNSQTLAWTFAQMFVPIIIILCGFLNPYKIAYLVPVYIYSIQIYFIFSSDTNDKSLMHLYAIGSVICFLITVFVFNIIFKKEENLRERVTLLESVLDLSYNIISHDKK